MTSTTRPPTPRCPTRWPRTHGPCSTSRCRHPCSGGSRTGIAGAGRAEGARVMVEKPFGTDLAQRPAAERHDARGLPRGRHLPGRPLAGAGPAGERAVRAVRQLGLRAAAQPRPTSRASRSRWPRRSTSPTAAASTTAPAPSATSCRTTCCRCWPASSPTRRPDQGGDSWLDAKSGVIGALRPLDAAAHRARAVRRLPRRARRRARVDDRVLRRRPDGASTPGGGRTSRS